jgi:hypothetical protein
MLRSLLIALTAASALSAASSGAESVPLFFVSNQGQAPSEVLFMAKGSGLTAYFLPTEARFRLENASIRVQFDGAATARVDGLERLGGKANFLTGAEDAWRRDVPLYGAIAYRELYPGVDMLYGANGRNLKSEFVVAPEADPSQIRLHYLGTGELRIDESGALVIPVEGRELREQAPEIYQNSDGLRERVAGEFVLAGDRTVSFIVKEYDRTRPLIIDPVLYSTLLGGSSSDAVNAMAVDGTGAVYVTGFTASYDFPTVNPKQNFDAGGNDAFVAKLSAAGNGLVYCTYLGGSGDDRAYGLVVDAGGSVSVTGSTTSRNFPVANALQTKLLGSKNAFIAKLSAAGNSLTFSTYLGGNGSDIGNGIAVDSSGNLYVVGDTTSTNFPATGVQKAKRGGQDAFVSKVSADGSRMLYSTYLGGTYDEHGAGIAVDSAGTAYVTGSTLSSDFPVVSAWQPQLGGGQDAFIARLATDGNSLLFSTFLGGSGGSLGYPEAGQGIALDTQGSAYIAGVTSSSNFPTLHPAQPMLRGGTDAFVAKVNSAGALVYSTYLGGSGLESGNAIAVDASGNAYIAGQTFSSDLPVVNAFQASSGGDYDAFVAKLSATGDAISAMSYLGGAGSDTATSVAVDTAGNVYLAGWTLSTNFPVVNGYQSVNAGSYGGFVAKASFTTGPPSAVSVTPSSGSGSSQMFSFLFSDAKGFASISTVSMLINGSLSASGSCYLYYARAANALYLANDAGTAWLTPIVLGQSATVQNSQCAVSGTASLASGSGNNLTLTLAVSFTAGFNGARNIYMEVYDGRDSGWQQRGAWTVTATGPPAPVSVTPSSGTGSSQVFSFLFTDPKGYTAIGSASVIVNGTLAAANGCYLYYARASNTIYLANDAATAWLSPLVIGQAGTRQNSQCAVNAAASSASGSGNNLTLSLALTFLSAFSGSKSLFMEAYDGQDSGWQQRGAWTATAAFGPVSVTPNSGSGNNQTFSLAFTDPKGYSAIASVSAIVNGALSAAASCYIYYGRASNSIYLANDAGTAWLTPVVLGQAGTLRNSQCTIDTGASSATASGNNLTLMLALTFQSAFKGAKSVYLEAYDGQDSGWQQLGTWAIP